VPLLSDPAGLLTQLKNKLNYSEFLPGANPVVEAARQRLQGTQQGLLQQNLILQQQLQQRRAQQQQRRQLQQMLLANLHAQQQQPGGPNPNLPAGIARDASGNFPRVVGPAPKGQVLNWIDRALNVTGHTGRRHDALENGLYNIIMHESSGNPLATNNWDSNAKAGTPSIGLMQTIQPTFDAYALSGHKRIRNPVDNIIAGLRYALSRYGYGMVMGGGRHDQYGNYIGY